MMTPQPLLLIHAQDPLIAALLGALLEQQGARPVFGESGDTVEAAAARLQPRLILADAAVTRRELQLRVDSARTTLDELATRVGSTIVLFGTAAECAALSGQGYDCYVLPEQREELCARVMHLLQQV